MSTLRGGTSHGRHAAAVLLDAPPRRSGRVLFVPVVAAVTTVMVVVAAWAFWTAGATAGSNGAAGATAVEQGATPSGSVSDQSVTVSWDATTLTTGQAVSGYVVKRYDAGTLAVQSILTACDGTITAETCIESSVPAGTWKYSITPVFATNWLGTESTKSSDVVVTAGSDTLAPTSTITLTAVTGNAGKVGTTIYYRGTDAGSFTLTNAVLDGDSGPASSETSALGGTTTGWTHTPSTVTTPSQGPYVSNTFSWTAGTTSGPTVDVTARDVAGNSTTITLTFVDDSTAPTAGTITYTDGYQPGLNVPVTFTTGTDGGSGIATRRLQRQSAPLTTADTCVTWTGFTNLGAVNPTSVYTDYGVDNGMCYQYRYVVTDAAGNSHTATTANVSKVDYAGAVNTTTGALSQWRLGEASGGGTTTINSDTFTTGSAGDDITARTPDVGTWSHKAGSTTEVLSNAGRARRSGSGQSMDYISPGPTGADYSVSADIYRAGALSGDRLGIFARSDVAGTSYYMARYENNNNAWVMLKYAGGGTTTLGSNYAQVITDAQTTTARLEVSGTTTTSLKLYIDGSLAIDTSDSTSPFTAAGFAGIHDGSSSGNSVKTDTAGLHVDNFLVTEVSTPVAADSKGSNPGNYYGGPTAGVAGSLTGDADTAVTFDGVDDYVQATGTTGLPTGAGVRSVEAWFKTTSSAKQVLFTYGSLVATQEFGLWIDTGGATMTAWGYGTGNDKTFTLAAAVDDGAWHQVVKTYDGTSITLYVDGEALTSQAATRDTVTDAYGFSIGAITTPGDANTGGYFNGTIDEVSFYTAALAPSTVTNHYELGTSTGLSTSPVVTTSLTSLAYTENDTATLDSAITVTDTNSTHLASATVTMTTAYVNGQDTLAFVNQNGITGTWTAGTGVLALTGSATVADYQTALRSITYTNSSNNPNTSTRTVEFVANDGTEDGNTATRGIAITPVNDAPVLTGSGGSMSYTENDIPTVLDAGGTVSDVDNANLASATVTMTTGYANGEDTLWFTTQNGITGTWTAGTGVLALTGTATKAQYHTALASITYSNSSNAPSTTTRAVTFLVNDGSANSNTVSRGITITAVNDAPVNGVPGSQGMAPDTTKTFSTANGNLISISDVDAASGTVQVTLTATNGTISLSGTTGLTFSTGDGAADTTMTFTGTLTDLNAALAGLGFTATTSFTGAASLEIVTSDQGNTGTGGTLTDTDTVDITVNSDSTAPTSSITLSGVSGNAALVGTTVYYRGTASGSFTLTNAVSDAGSGPASSETAALGGTTTGWTHTPSTVSTPAGGPYVSNAFSWTAGTTSGPTEVVTGRDVAGNSAESALTFVDDSTPPSDGTLSYTDGYQPGLSVPVTFTTGTDGGSGIGTRQLQRQYAPLTAGTCGTWSGFTNLGAVNPTSVYTDYAVANATCYQYRYVVTDVAGNVSTTTSANVSKVDYAGAVAATTGALSQWRLGESGSSPITLDSFTGTSGATVSSRSGEVGATWTYRFGATSVISDAGMARRDGSGYSIYDASAIPSSADYAVEADYHHRGALTDDALGILGRWDSASLSYYMVRYEEQYESWTIYKSVNNVQTYFDGWVGSQPLTVGQTYRVRLEMSGSTTTTIKMFVNGVQMGSTATDSTDPVTAAGRAGFWDGINGGATVTKTNTVGLHLDNFQVTPLTYPRAVDSKGSNTADYQNGPTFGAAGALAGDTDTAASFDGVNDYVQAVATTGIPTGAGLRSVEAWFKTSSAARQVLFSYGTPASTQEFGLWLDSGGTQMTSWGWGSGNDKAFTLSTAVNDGAWHHVVKTYDGTSITLYVDGVALTPQTATRDTVMDAYGFGIGAVIRAGDTGSGGFFTGSIDEVSFYTSVLSQMDVTNHYQLGTSTAPPPSDAPVLTTSVTSLAYTENDTATLDSAITVTDTNSTHLASATVTMTTAYVNGQDTLAFVNQNGITGTWTAGTGVLALTGSATLADYQTALRSITYTNSSDDPNTTTRTVTFVANDGTEDGNTATRGIAITPVNDAPALTGSGGSMSYTENDSATVLDAGGTVSDVDNANLASATVTMTTAYANGEDTLWFTTQNGITGTWTAGTGVLALTGTATKAQYETALASITYSNSSDDPSTTTRAVTFLVNDGSANSNTVSRGITITAVNDAPVNSVPGTQTTATDTTKVFSTGNGNLISISDVDAASGSMQVQLTATNGTVSLSGTTGLTFSTGDGTGDATMTFTGTVAAVNTALAGLSLIPTAAFNGTATLQIVTSDQGNTGTGGTLTDTDTVDVTVAPAANIAFRASTAVGSSGAVTSLAVDKPAGVVDGDVMLATITTRDTAVTTLSGWTLLSSTTNPNDTLRTQYYWKVAASEGSSYTWTMGSSKTSITVIAFSGVDTTDPFIAQSSQNNASSITTTAPAQIPGIENTFVVYSASMSYGTTYTEPPTGFSAFDATSMAKSSGQSGASQTTTAVSYKAMTTQTTTTGALTATANDPQPNTGWSATLRPGS